MAFNVFEGARRLAYVLTAVAIGGTGFHIWEFSNLPATARYEVTPFEDPVLLVGGCVNDEDIKRVISRHISSTSVSVTLCFPKHKLDNGSSFYVWKQTDGKIYGNTGTTNDLFAYIDRESAAFSIPEKDTQSIRTMHRSEIWVEVRETLAFLAGLLVAFWLLVFAIGWIVRGFFGIPRGRDSRTGD